MKSQLNILLSVAYGYLIDARMACVYQEIELSRDYAALRLGSRTRGLAFFTLDLPSLDSLLLAGLASGKLSTSGPLSRRRSKADHRPKFLWPLWSRVFDSTGCLLENACPNAIFFLRCISCLGKKDIG
jgi:hypothetical protein